MAHRYILACSVFIFCRVNGDLLYGLKGLNVSLEPTIPSKPADILWKYNGNKLVEFNGNEQHVYGTFKNRITLHWHTAKLEITDLRLEDSGNYELDVTINNGLHRSSNRLVVIDKVSKPTISCQMNDGSIPNKSGTLECSAESKDSQTQSLTKFEWESRGNGPLLTISLGGEHDDHVYICNVSNPKSSETTAFTAKDCYPDESSSVALAAGLVTTLIIVVVLGLAVAYICYRKRNRKAAAAAEKINDVEKQSDQTKVSESDQMTAQADEKDPLLDETNKDQQLSREPAVADQPGETVEKGGKMNKGTAPPVAPCSALSPGPAKNEDPAGEPADLGKDKMPHQESSAAPEESGSDQTTAQAEEKGTPTDGAATDQQPDRNKDGEMNNDKAPSVPSQPAEEEVPQSEPSVSEKANKPDPAGEPADLGKDKMPHQESSADPPPDMTTGGKVNKRTAPPVAPRSAWSPRPAKKEDPADEPADLGNKMPHQEPSPAPEESGSDQTAQAEEKSTPTDGAATDQQPDRNKDGEMNNDKAPPVPPQPAEEEVPQSEPSVSEKVNKPDPAGEPADLGKDKMPHQESSADPPPDMTTGGKVNKRTAPPVAPRSAWSPRPAKKEDPADEPADLGNKMPHQEPSPAPEESGSDQTTAQAEENSTPTDGAATDQQPDRNKDGEMNNDKAPPVPPQPAEEEVPQANEQDQAGLENDKDEHERTGTPPTSPPYVNSVRRKFEQGSDQTTAQAEEKSTPTDGAATDQQPDRKKGYVNSVRRKFEKEEDGEANVPSDSVSPAKALSPLTQNSPNVTPENSAGEQSEDVDKPASTPGNELVNVDTPQQPHSPIPTKPDNEHTKTLQDSPDTPHETPDREKKTTQDSDESNEDEDETAQCGPKEEKPEQ